MKSFLKIMIILSLIFTISGCTTFTDGVRDGLSASWHGIKNITSRGSQSIANASERRKKRVEQKRREKEIRKRGYLAKQDKTLRKQNDIQASGNKEEMNITTYKKNSDILADINIRKSSKTDLLKVIMNLEEKYKDEKKIKDRALDELSSFKVQFQKHLFESSNLLEKEKQMNRELSSQINNNKFEAIEAKQNLEKIRSSLIAKRGSFISSYPIYYEVVRGDSLWKIAGRSKIYKNPFKWLEIFFANQEKIKDKDEIYPGTILKIPRYHEYMLSDFETSSKNKFIPVEKKTGEIKKGKSTISEYNDYDNIEDIDALDI